MLQKPVMWSEEDEAQRGRYWDFAQTYIAPRARDIERAEAVPEDIIGLLASNSLLGALVSPEYGGPGCSFLHFGFLNEALGAACSSTRTLLTVHSMVCQAVSRWGTAAQKERFLPGLAAGTTVGAFALTEPQAGSDARGIETVARPVEGGYRLQGVKRWISFGQRADLFLVMAVVEKPTSVPSESNSERSAEGSVPRSAEGSATRPTERRADRPALALLVPGNTPGLRRQPISGLLGTKASLLAELHFDDCFVPAENVLSRPGFGLAICSAALEIGRLSVAWGGVGIAQACLEASASYAQKRQQFDKPIASHQLVQAKITDMMVETSAARLLCVQASRARQAQLPSCVLDILMAKYQGARVAQKAAQEAVQIHGANGCSDDYPVARYYRDAKTLEIIEGTSEILQGLIAQQVRMAVRH